MPASSKEKYGTPWFEGSFYGVADTSQAFRDFARLLGDADLSERTEAMIAREEARVNTALEPWRQRLQGKRVLLYTGGVKSWSVISALQDLGLTVVATGTTKSTEEDKGRIRELMGDEVRLIEDGSPTGVARRRARVGGRYPHCRRPQHVHRLEGRLPFLDINQERDFGYLGYEGMLELARQLALTLESPVWEAVARPTPWEVGIISN